MRLHAHHFLGSLQLVLGSLLLVGSAAAVATAEEPIRFNEQIRPILSRHCIACHGPDEEDRQADLRLDTFAGATDWAITPGDAESSEVIARIETDDEDLRMPPPEHADALKEEELALLKAWIEQGAEYEVHWSFAPLIRPEAPSDGSSDGSTGAVHNDIDRFIQRKADEAGLAPNPPADPRVLIRRLSLGLTGLPPLAHGESVQGPIAAYLAAPSQERLGPVVDALLETTAYAERWAAVWLDMARYADTVGYSGDERREVWPWRDWLIRSIQANKSYRDLSIEMLAGDLLPGATDEQRLATAFHRNTLANNEGGTDDEEFRTIAVKDRLSTTLNGWMGLTVRCAECHSHKYDPISHEEYYQLLDFFNQTADSDKKDERPKLDVYAEPDPSVLAKLDAQIAELHAKIAGTPEVWTVRRPVETRSENGTKFELQENDSILATGPNPDVEQYYLTFELPAGESIQGFRIEALPHQRHGGAVGRGFSGGFILSQIKLLRHDGEEQTPVPLADAEADFHQINRHPKTTIEEDVPSKSRKHGWAVNHPVTGYKDHHEVIYELEAPLVAEQATRFTVMIRHDAPWARLNLGCVRVSTCDVAESAGKYKRKELDQPRRELRKALADREAPIRVPVMEELPKNLRRKTHVMLRGNFRSPGERVHAEYPAAFKIEDEEFTTDRLGLARWLFAEENPLTARVAVNRYWSRLMGIGLVETEEDFGTQGTPPSHPELLDYLAVEFRENGWDVRRLLKQIVMSATYQQSAAVTPEALEQDPQNRLLARGPRIRLSAEVVRDQALAVSGLLSKKKFGAPVYPPSPIKRYVNAFTGGMTWPESEGEDRYRRAIYTFLKRTAPHPLFDTFDMASRDVCNFRRLRTNTPLQSFMTLNDITFVEAARALADDMIAAGETASTDDRRLEAEIEHGLRTALYAEGSPAQVETLAKLYHRCVADYADDLAAAAELTGAAKGFDAAGLPDKERDRLVRHAALTVVGNVILNLDGFLNN